MVASARQRRSVTKLIYFYRVIHMRDLRALPEFTAQLFKEAVISLKGGARYFPQDDEFDLCVIPDSDARFRFGKIRKRSSPTVEHNGRVKPLVLPSGEKLFDCVHVVFFDHDIVGAEFNLYGPRISTLTEYMLNKVTRCKPVVFDRLVHGDILERLNHYGEIKLVEIRVDTSRSEVISPLGAGWVDVARNLRHEMGVGSLEIVLRAGHTAHRPLIARTMSAVREIFSSQGIRDAADKFRITAVPEGSKTSEPLDLLDDKLVRSIEVPSSIYRNPDEYGEYMYREIEKAYQLLEAEITQAIGARA